MSLIFNYIFELQKTYKQMTSLIQIQSAYNQTHRQPKQTMIKSQFKNRIDHDKVSRHSSQLALRKPSQQIITPRQLNNNELGIIKKTAFWIKKSNNSSGLQNLPPNSKKLNSSRNKQNLSVKMRSRNSQTSSICHKTVENQNHQQFDSKLALIQKSQKQIILQTQKLISENLPKLSSCQKSFQFLNKTLRMAFNNSAKFIGSQFLRMLDNHIQITNDLFSKVLKHSSQFVNANKCAHLINKNIELQKQKNKREILISKLQNQQYKNKKQNIQKKFYETNDKISLKCIDYERVLLSNYRVNQYKFYSNQNEIYNSIIAKLLTFNNKKQANQFVLFNNAIKCLVETKQANGLLKKIVTEIKNKINCVNLEILQKNNKTQHSFKKEALFDILLCKFDVVTYQLLKKKIMKLNQLGYFKYLKEDRVSLKQLIQILNKLTVIKNNQKIKQIMVNLLIKCQLKGRARLNQKQVYQIGSVVDESRNQIIQKYKVQSKSLALYENLQKLSKINNLSNKRLINCASMHQSRNNTKSFMSKKHSNYEFNSQNAENLQYFNFPSLITQSYLPTSQFMLILYNFIKEQFFYLQLICLSQYENITSIQSQNLSQYNKILQKHIPKNIYDKIKSKHIDQKCAIFQMSDRLSKLYDSDFKNQFKQMANKQLFKYLKQQITEQISGEYKKIMLTQLLNENTKTIQNQSIQIQQIQAFDEIQIRIKS